MLLALLLSCFATAEPLDGPVFTGRCDASAFVPVGPDQLWIADDEKQSIGRFAITGGEGGKISLKDFLDVDGEPDLEGAAQLGERAYFIGSHGRNGQAEPRPDRERLFALIPSADGEPTFAGQPYKALNAALFELPDVGPLLAEAAKRAPKDPTGGLNIEALGTTPEGALLIGLRNPLAHGRAILVTLSNPAAVVDTGAKPVLTATTVDLGGRGFRAMARDPKSDQHWIVAGAVDGRRDFALFQWDGTHAVRQDVDFGTLNPEAIHVFDDGRILILSDDGTERIGGKPCKDAPSAARHFRSLWLSR